MLKKLPKILRTRLFRYLAVGFAIAFFLVNIFLVFSTYQGSKLDLDALNASQYGEFVGGYIGTILSFIGIVLLFLSFTDQEKSNKLEKFESKYFDMIKMHRDNINEIGIGNEFGRKVFVLLLREYRVIHKLVKRYIAERNVSIPDEVLFDVSYKIFYYGTGLNSTRILINSIPDKYIQAFSDLIFEIGKRHVKERYMKDNNFKYIPFEGHQSRLGHYYRHIFQTIRYVDKQDDSFLSSDEKYSYVKILRAQLSTHEQALFFLNSLSSLGRVWRDEKQQISVSKRGKILMETYQLIKNLPNQFFSIDKEINPEKVYPLMNFEWNDYDRDYLLPLYKE